MLRVLTFNVVHDSLLNFAAPWTARRALVVETIRSCGPDVACLQEVSERQVVDLADALPEYDFAEGISSGPTRLPSWASAATPVARWILGDFHDRGELCPILLRRGAVSAPQRGAFRLGDGDGSSTPHAVTWVRLESSSGLPAGTVYNAHLGLVPWRALRIAKELVQTLDRRWDANPQILAGDFNSTPRGPVVKRLLAERPPDRPPRFQDAWTQAAHRSGSGRTFHWGFGLPGPRLDYILLRPGCAVRSASTHALADGRIFSSDHAALLAEIDTTPSL